MESSKTLAIFGMVTAFVGGLSVWGIYQSEKSRKERDRMNRIEEMLLHQEVSSRRDV